MLRIEYAKELIEKAEQRLEQQKAVVATIDEEKMPQLIALAQELVLSMEEKLAILHRVHREIMEDEMLKRFVPAIIG